MRLWELFEDLSSAEIKNVETKLNRNVYMPSSEVSKGGPVLKLTLPTNQHFGDRVSGDNSGRRAHEHSDFTADDVESLLAHARMDPSYGYANDLEKLASFPGPGDYPANGNGYQIRDPTNNLLIPVVVKPNPDAKKLVSKNTVATNKGVEPRNLLKAKTIMFHRTRKGEAPVANDKYGSAGSKKPLARPAFKPYVHKPKKPDMSDYDDESTD